MINLLKRNFDFLIFTLLVVFFFYKIIFSISNIIYPAGDVINAYYAWESFLVYQIKSYNMPLWNPYNFSGETFIANTQIALFSPLIILFLFLPTHLAFNYAFIIEFAALGIFTYLFARSIRMSRYGAVVSSIIIMFSGSLMVSLYLGHIFIINTFVGFPLLLYFYEQLIQKGKIRYGIYAAVATAYMILAGHIQIAFYSIFISNCYFYARLLYEFILQKKILYIRRLILIPFFSLFIAILLSSVQLLPAVELALHSSRSLMNLTFASDFSVHPKELISFALPHFFGTPMDNNYWGMSGLMNLLGYMGVPSVLFTLIAISRKNNVYTLIFLLLSAFSLIFALGKYTFLFPIFYLYVPFFNLFRVPARMLFFYSFSIAILAGYGIHLFFDKKELKNLKKQFYKKFLIVLIVFSIIIFLLTLFLFKLQNNVDLFNQYILKHSYAQGIDPLFLLNEILNELIFFSLILFTTSSILLAKIIIPGKNKLFYLAILSVIIFDLWHYGSNFYTSKKIDEVFATPKIIKTIKSDSGQFRVFDMTGLFTSTLQYNKIESVTGINPIILQSYKQFLWTTGSYDNNIEGFINIRTIDNLLPIRILNTKYVISKNKLGNKDLFLVDKAGKFFLYKLDDTLPRAFIVPYATTIISEDKILSALAKKDFDPRKLVILEEKVIPRSTRENFKEANIIEYHPNRIRIKTSLNSPAYLVLGELWYPGWKANDNGREVKILKANYLFRSLYLEKGKHDIVFFYDPGSFKVGAFISLATLAIVMLFTLKYILSSRRKWRILKSL